MKNSTIQIVMSDREKDLLKTLADKLGVTRSAILEECIKLSIESSESEQTQNKHKETV